MSDQIQATNIAVAHPKSEKVKFNEYDASADA